MGTNPDGEGDEGSASSDHGDDSDSDSSSSFKMASDSEDDAKKKKKKRQPAASTKKPKGTEEAPRKTEGKARADEKPDKQPEEKKVRKGERALRAKQERAEKLKSTALKAHAALTEVSADMVWRSVIRTGEIEKRITKSQQTERELQSVMEEFFEEDSEVQILLKDGDMSTFREYMTHLKDLCKALRAISPEAALQDVCAEEGGQVCLGFIKCFHILLSKRDCATLSDMLVTFAKRLFDAHVT